MYNRTIKEYCPNPLVRDKVYVEMCLKAALLLLSLVLFFGVSQLSAQLKSEEYQTVMNWSLPQTALDYDMLIQKDDIFTYQDAPFSGVAYSKYPNGALMRAVSYLDGKQSGQMLLWYPDGAPQMSANYMDGALHGRFLGWYQNGGMIYDMMINHGAYAGDSLAEEDNSRTATEGVDVEGEVPDNDQSKE